MIQHVSLFLPYEYNNYRLGIVFITVIDLLYKSRSIELN